MFPQSSGFNSKFLARMFRKIEGLCWDINTGKLGISSNQGIFTLNGTTTPGEGTAAATTSYRVSINPFDVFGIAIPAFATQVPSDKIAIGDIIVGDKGILGWVVEKKNIALVLMDQNGMTKNYTPPKVEIMGSDGALVVQSLFGLAGGDDGLKGFQNSMMPLLMMMEGNGDTSSLDKILPLLLLSQQGAVAAGTPGAAPAINPMMLMMMMGGSDIDPMMMMMLSGGFGGGAGGMNPMMMMAMMGGDKPNGMFGKKNAIVPANANAIGGAPALQPLRR